VFTALVKKLLRRLYDGAAAMCKKLTQKKFEKDFEMFEKYL
jgi:methanogenic corrinoid protein MtbC1